MLFIGNNAFVLFIVSVFGVSASAVPDTFSLFLPAAVFRQIFFFDHTLHTKEESVKPLYNFPQTLDNRFFQIVL